MVLVKLCLSAYKPTLHHWHHLIILFIWAKSIIRCSESRLTKFLLSIISVLPYLSFPPANDIDADWLHSTTVDSVHWYGSQVTTSHVFSGKYPAIGKLQPYPWRIFTSSTIFSATWCQGNEQGTLRWPPPPLPVLHQQVRKKGKVIVLLESSIQVSTIFIFLYSLGKLHGVPMEIQGHPVIPTPMSLILLVPFFQISHMRRPTLPPSILMLWLLMFTWCPPLTT